MKKIQKTGAPEESLADSKRAISLLDAIQKVQSLYIANTDTDQVFKDLLTMLVELTQSEYGFLDEVFHDPEKGLFKVSLVLTNVAWDADSTRLYQELAARNLEFHNLNNLSGAPVMTQKLVIANDPVHDPRRGGLPPGHPALNSFMGIPMFYGRELVGVAGVANRPGGYDESLARFLDPFISTCAGIIHAERIRQKERVAREALAASEERYRRITETVTDYIYSVRIENGTAVDSQHAPGCLSVTGYSAEEFAADTDLWFRMILAEDQPRVEEHIRHAFSCAEVPAIEHRIIRKDGALRWVRNTPIIRHDQAGRIQGYDGLIQDITDRKQAEMALQRSEEQYRTVVSVITEGIIFQDASGKILAWNKSAEEIFGLKAEEVVGRTSLDYPWQLVDEQGNFLPGEEHPSMVTLRTGKPCTGKIVGLKRTDDDLRWISVNTRLVLKDGENTPSAVVISFADITEKRHAEIALRENEERLRFALGEIQMGEWELNLTDHTAFRSLTHDRIFGYETLLPEWTYEMFLGHVLPEDREHVDRLFQGAVAAHSKWDFECRIIRTDGQERWIRAQGRFCPAELDKSSRLVGVVQDITEQKQAEEERRRLESRLVELQKLESLGDIAAGVAHDFNNILHTIIGNVQISMMELPLESRVRENLREIDAAARRGADIALKMLAYSGRGRFVMEPLDISRLVHEMRPSLESCKSAQCELRFQLAPRLPRIEADANHIRQILLNLVTNASEAIGAESGIISVSSGAMVYDKPFVAEGYPGEPLAPGQYVYVEVTDNGCGIEPATFPRLYDPFFSTKFPGRGLGLPAVVGIVRRHKGSIQVSSKLGIGSVFRVFLPAMTEPAEPAYPDDSEENWSGSGAILIIDDDASVCRLAKFVVEQYGFKALTVTDESQAVQVFLENENAIVGVLMDLMMPIINGVELFYELQRLRPGTPVILSSGYEKTNVMNRFYKDPKPFGFLQKPFKMESLLALLKQLAPKNSL